LRNGGRGDRAGGNAKAGGLEKLSAFHPYPPTMINF
jgi:hypothetical protein